MFRALSAHLHEDTIVYMQHMVLSPSTSIRGGLSLHSLSETFVFIVARREKKVGIKHSLLKAQKQLSKHHSSSNCSSPTSPEMQTSPESPQNWAHGVSENDTLLDRHLNP